MDIIGNNIANLNTTGFKSATGNLVDAFSNTLQAATAATGNDNGTDAMQIGTGVMTGSITNDWSAGGSTPPAWPATWPSTAMDFSSCKIQPPAPNTSPRTALSPEHQWESGDLHRDGSAWAIPPRPFHQRPHPDQHHRDAFHFQPDRDHDLLRDQQQGVITVNLSDGTSFARGQVLLQNFTDPQALTSVGNNLYSNMANAGGLAAPGAPGSGSLGTIQSGALELSNVDLSAQMADLIVAQRAFEANSKIITTSDELLQDVVNMKR
jgi:flagellar hook protein FlgE